MSHNTPSKQDRVERHLSRQRGAGVRNLISNFGFCFAIGPAPVARDIHPQEPPGKRRKIDNEVRTASAPPISDSGPSKPLANGVEGIRGLDGQVKRPACKVSIEAIIETTTSMQAQPAKRGRKKKEAAITIEIIGEQETDAGAHSTTPRARPKRRAAEDAAAKVMADLIEEGLPIDKKRRDEVPAKASRQRKVKATRNIARSSLKESSADALPSDPTTLNLALAVDRIDCPGIVLPSCGTGAEVRDARPRKRARVVGKEKLEDLVTVVIAGVMAEDVSAARKSATRVPLAETDMNNVVITKVLNDGSKEIQAPILTRKPRGRPPSKTSTRGTVPKPKRKMARLSIHNDHSDAEDSSPRPIAKAAEQVEMLVAAQPSNPEFKRAALSENRREVAGEEYTHHPKKVAKRITASEIEEELQVCMAHVLEQPSTTESSIKVPKRKLLNRIVTNDTDIDKELATRLETDEIKTRSSLLSAPPIISASTATTSETRKRPEEPVPVKKRGRPRKTPECAPAAIRASTSEPNLPDARERRTGKAPESTKLSKSGASHAPSQTITQVQSRHHVDEDVDWLFAPSQTRSKPAISKPRVTASQQEIRKASVRDLPEMDLEELLSGITSLAAMTHPQMRLTKRMKGRIH